MDAWSAREQGALPLALPAETSERVVSALRLEGFLVYKTEEGRLVVDWF